MRLNKYIAESGIASRRKAEELIEQGRVSINGKVITKLATIVDPENDTVAVDGEKLKQQKKLYFLLNKPKGVITTTKDEKGRKSVTDLIQTKEKIFPVGRLDYNTTGVLLITNDGDFTNKVLHPKNKIERTYKAKLDSDLSDEHIQILSKGIQLDDRKSRFTKIEFDKISSRKVVLVTTVEGRNHFVKRMFLTLGYTVKELERISFGNFTCNGIPKGNYVQLAQKDINKFLGEKY